MVVLNEGFSLVKNNEKLLDCTASLVKESEQYSLLLNDERVADFQFGREDLFCRFAISELNHRLVSSMEILRDSDAIEVVTHPQNRLFFLKAVRCQHKRSKGLLRGDVCNKLIFNSFSSNKLGGRIHCPRCQNISYV